jgi:TonB dependent receptor/TonB-dependent Receptor Plug Domain
MKTLVSTPIAAACAALFCLSDMALAQDNTTATATPQPTQSIEIKGVRLREKASQTTLTSDELKRVPGSGGDPMRAVQSLPGVASADDSSSEPAVRGARPSDNLYYVDFLPVGYLFHVGGLTSVFNADLIRRFDMYSAAWSPEYGDALGAVFDLSLRRPRTDRIGGKLDISFLGATALFEGPLGKDKSFFLSARRSWFDLVAKTGEDKKEGVSFTTPVYTDSQGRFLWTLNDNNRVRFDFSTASDRSEFTVKQDARIALQQPVLAGSSSDRQGYTSAALVWDADLGNAGAHTLALGNMSTRLSTKVGAVGAYTARISNSYLRHQVQISAGKNHDLTLGASVQSQQVKADIDFRDPRCTEFDPNCDPTNAVRVLTQQDERQNLADVFVNDRWRLTPRLTATLGLRFNQDGYLKRNTTEPRLGLEYSWSPQTLITAAAGRHNQAPAIEQSLRGVGNPRLSRLQATHVAVGIQQRISAGWNWKAEVYGKRFEDLVVSNNTTNYANGASGTAQGFELLIKREPAGSNWSGFLSLSVAKAQRKNEVTGERFAFDYDQPVNLNLVGSYKLNDRWSFGAKWSYHTGTPTTPIVGSFQVVDGPNRTTRFRPIYGSINSQRLPDYHRLDLRVDAKFSPRLTAYAELINAYARKNVGGYSYSADYKTREEVYQLPVLPSLGLQYSF